MPREILQPEFDFARELREISEDFLNPLEVLREAVANAYDAGARRVRLRAARERDPSGRIVLNLYLRDDGLGMDHEILRAFFGLGVSRKPPLVDRPPIGFKGHGTKLYYRANEIWVATRSKGAPLLLAHVPHARQSIRSGQKPDITLLTDPEASQRLRELDLEDPSEHGTTIALIDFTADSRALVDVFTQQNLDNYLRWFTIHGSFEHVIEQHPEPTPVMDVLLQGTDTRDYQQVAYGHDWPSDRTSIPELRKKDERRPFNYFVKTFVDKQRTIKGGATIDIAVAFEGKRGRIDRDPCIHRQGATRWYSEEERYGLWLCRDYIPIELRSDWLRSDELSDFADIEPKRALVLVNCDEFLLTANRGSVGNSQPSLLEAVRDGVTEYLQSLADDKSLRRFLDEYQEDRRARARDKDGKALRRRIDRFNRKDLCRIEHEGRTLEFLEPQREITLYGLLCRLQQWDPNIIELDILDYDDHRGIDLLVRQGPDPANLTSRDNIRYTELKYQLEPRLNHAFKWLHSIICWKNTVVPGDTVTDITNVSFAADEHEDSLGVTHTILRSLPSDRQHTHNVRVIVLSRLLEQTRGMVREKNPRRINGR